MPSADLWASLLAMLRLARQHRVKDWITDNCLLRAMRPTDLEWVGSDIMLPMSALGVRRLAAVESLDAITGWE